MSRRELISSYDQPIILGLTPYTKTRVSIETLQRDWPPFIDADRLTRYEEFLAVIENRAQDVFASLQLATDQKDKITLAAALPELLCDVWADAVWSDPPTIELPSTALDEQWRAIDTANDFTEGLAWESVFGAAGWGTSVLYLRRLREDEPRVSETTDVKIEEIDPGIFFPIMRPGSSRDIERVVLAWEEDRAAPDERPDFWQVKELHEVVGGQYQITTFQRRTREAMSTQDWTQTGFEQPTGVDFLPFVDMHSKRWRGRYWGVSELSRAMGLFDEIDNTLSNIAEILEYHGKPMLQVPKSAIFGGFLTKGADKTMGVTPDQADIARYITYDGQIASQLEHLDKLIELTFLTAQVPRTYFGLGPEASSAPSGVSLKLQLQNYLKKAGRWQRAETQRLNRLIPMALRLGYGSSIPLSLEPEIAHGSPLPADDEQEVRIITAATTSKILTRRSAITRLKRLGYVEDVDDEIDELDQEREDSIAALPAPMQTNIGGNSSTNPNGGEEPPA